ncbi:MAG: IS1182 family transposase [Thermoanaerobaculia bacterium]
MARYKPYDYRQTKMLPVRFEEQILPGTFEYTLNRLIDESVDLTVFEARYRNDDGGAPAYDPAVLLKLILLAYSRGITSSRQIERLCRENVLFMAISADSQPHFTTIAHFIATLDVEITTIFRDVLLVCDEAGLIGKEMFAVDGVKLPSNASKEWSGSQADYSKKIEKMERAVRYLTQRHQAADTAGEDEGQAITRAKQQATLEKAIAKVRGYLQGHQDKVGSKGRTKQSNITDNESAKMTSSKGVIQGYTAVAMVDGKHQIVVHAEAHGEGQEHGLLIPMIEGARKHFGADPFKAAVVLADAGYCSEANAQYLSEEHIDGYVADPMFRKRDPRFVDAVRHKPTRPDEPFAKPKREIVFRPKDFAIAADRTHAICPAGKRLYRNGRHKDLNGFEAIRFRGNKSDCRDCALRAKCLRHPDRTVERQVAVFIGRAKGKPETYSATMKRKIDSDLGRHRYSRRLGIVEPVFANLRSTHRLDRFSHRGQRKVTTQWQLFCLVHNIGKVQRYAA